jgi:hypothetical protein
MKYRIIKYGWKYYPQVYMVANSQWGTVKKDKEKKDGWFVWYTYWEGGVWTFKKALQQLIEYDYRRASKELDVVAEFDNIEAVEKVYKALGRHPK